MKSTSIFLRKISALLIVITAFAIAVPGTLSAQEDKKLSEGESKALTAIQSAPDAAAKLAAAREYVKKYPKSTNRAEVSGYLAGQIDQVRDGAQKLALAETYQQIFNTEQEQETIRPVILDAYFDAKRTDDAFALAATILAKQPENVFILSRMMIAGTDEAKRNNAKYVATSQQYGLKAIELIEANKKPADVTDAAWEKQKSYLPVLYQNTAILALMTGKSAEASTRLEKAIALDPSEAFNYVLLGSIANEEYQKLATAQRSMPAGPEKAETLKKATATLDKVIDLYAHAVAASEGKPQYQQIHDQVMQDLTPYYKYRHNQSTEGLQQLIDKYKTTAKP